MADSARCVEVIRAKLSSLSGTSQTLAEYILSDPNRGAFLNAAELARESGVSHASVIRFAKVIGYAGYPELQKALQNRLSHKLTTVERLDGLDRPQQTVWEQLLQGDMANLAATTRELDKSACDQAATWVSGARTVYIVGFRSTANVVQLAAFALRQIRAPGSVVVVSPTECYDQLAQADEQDVVLAFSFPWYYRLTLTILELTRSKGLRSVVITDSLAAPAAQLADVTLTCRVAIPSFVESFVVPVSLVNALVTAVAMQTKEEALPRLAALDKAWLTHNIYAKENKLWDGKDPNED